ncbi:MAG TPA: glycerophosphodiester phosphodiesterase family protein, partial [Candidatus Saccharimonadia bacterium]|nr:glycerophosphodiester phosphodiesterase family protein [Candidatus Saccharimonadia bacterium]
MLQLSRYNPTWLTRVPIAHRGLHSDGVPENSLPAFKAAVTGGYGIELDLRMSVDGQLVVIHDATTDRMTGKSLRVSQVSADRLSTLALAETTFTIPTLDTALGAIRGAVPV